MKLHHLEKNWNCFSNFWTCLIILVSKIDEALIDWHDFKLPLRKTDIFYNNWNWALSGVLFLFNIISQDSSLKIKLLGLSCLYRKREISVLTTKLDFITNTFYEMYSMHLYSHYATVIHSSQYISCTPVVYTKFHISLWAQIQTYIHTYIHIYIYIRSASCQAPDSFNVTFTGSLCQKRISEAFCLFTRAGILHVPSWQNEMAGN